MSLIATDKGSEFETTPEGTYVARCFKVIDLGTQVSPTFGTEAHKVMISWELFDDDVKMADGRPYSVSQFYTVSLNEKANLRKHLEAWRGKKFTAEELEGFDLNTVLGAYCMIQVVHSEDGKYANVNSIMSYKGEKPKPVNPDVSFDIENPDMDVFNSFSDNMKAKIMGAPEWKGVKQDAVNLEAASKQVAAAAPAPIVKPDVIAEVEEDEPIDLSDIPF
jgi:hypothetical protein